MAGRLRANVGWLAQAALATAAAWVLAQQIFGHERPIFAPVAALIGVSASLGQRRRSAVEMVIGVALGIGIADALVVLIGTGPAQIAVVVCGAMAVAIAFGGSTALVGEAAASALLVVTIQLPETGLSGVRFLDSLLGGIVAIAVTSLLPRNPVEAVHRAAAPLLGEIAGTLEDVARALERRDRELAERAWTRSHGLRLAELDSSVAAGREMLHLAPFRSGTREQFARYEQAAAQIRTALTSVEALSRGAVRALTVGDNVPAPVPDSLRDLAETVRTLDDYLDDPAGRPVVREPALRAAAQATLVLEQTSNLSVSVIVAQVRLTAVDLIRGMGAGPRAGGGARARDGPPIRDRRARRPRPLLARRVVDTTTRHRDPPNRGPPRRISLGPADSTCPSARRAGSTSSPWTRRATNRRQPRYS